MSADRTFAEATLARYLAATRGGDEAYLRALPPAELAAYLRAWLTVSRVRRAMLAEDILRSLEGTEGDRAPGGGA